MKELGVVICTNRRIDDARINMELIRSVWKGTGTTRIVHSYNGDPEAYTKPYLEDDLVRIPNSGHFQGAAELIDAGVAVMQEKHSEVKYTVVLTSDDWIVDPDTLARVTDAMEQGGKRLATSSWGLPEDEDPDDIFRRGMATDFFVVDQKWASKNGMLPLDYAGFENPPKTMLLGGKPMLEKLAFKRFEGAVVNETGKKVRAVRLSVLERLHRITEREPVHSGTINGGRIWVRNFESPRIGLIADHDPGPKKKALEARGIKDGINIQRLLTSDELSYYNNPDKT